MLCELLESWLTPSGRHARRLGYVREGVAIEARHRRCRRAWKPHLEASRSAILSEAEGLDGIAAVLGSGALLDVPLAQLAARFRAVYLVDLFHPWSARLKALRFANVHLVDLDLLGIAVDGDPKAAPSRLRDWRRYLPGPVDFVVSLNLLSQLPLRPLERWGEDLGEAWMTRVMLGHLDDLRQGPGRACLISEFCHRSYDDRGCLIEVDPLLAGMNLPEPLSRWVWPLAPLGEMSAGESLEMDVGAFRL
ncbi:MAG TPA: hypothetical protein VM661_17100 [Candidatus Sulfotelmatobacter sp.]|jgi:hypothetical protein|nr:hypothetical protein [Candidatus Sulfotelmatobacter sp.]